MVDRCVLDKKSRSALIRRSAWRRQHPTGLSGEHQHGHHDCRKRAFIPAGVSIGRNCRIDPTQPQCNPQIMHQAQQWLAGQIGQEALDRALSDSWKTFHPRCLWAGGHTEPIWPARQTAFRIARWSWTTCSSSGSKT